MAKKDLPNFRASWSLVPRQHCWQLRSLAAAETVAILFFFFMPLKNRAETWQQQSGFTRNVSGSVTVVLLQPFFHFRLSELSQFLFCLDKGVSARFSLYSQTEFTSLDFSKNKMSVICACHSSHLFRKCPRTSARRATTPTARWSFYPAAAFNYVPIQPFRGSSRGSALAESFVWEASDIGTGFGLLMVPSFVELINMWKLH